MGFESGCPRHSDCVEIKIEDDSYPPCLRELENPPKTLYVRGNVDVLASETISVIGARRATPYGLAAAEMIGRIAAESELVVVSGGAIGCDSAASRAAVAAGGKTIIIPGCGADVVYPHASKDVFEAAVARGGAIVSAERWGAQPKRYMFPRRNPIIAAFSPALVIAEAGVPSGTFQTATAAADLSRQVFCVPGSIFSANSRGTNALIEQGAAIIPDERALEVLISMTYRRERYVVDGEDDPGTGRVMSALIAQPSRADDLASRLGLDILTVLRTLTDLEASKSVVRLPSGLYSASEEELLRHNVDIGNEERHKRGSQERRHVPRMRERLCRIESS